MKKLLICIGLALTLSACSSGDHLIRFNMSPQPTTKAAPSYEGKSHFFFWGMGQETDYDLKMKNVCQATGINTIDVYWTWYDSLMGGLTMGIYAPESFAIYCN